MAAVAAVAAVATVPVSSVINCGLDSLWVCVHNLRRDLNSSALSRHPLHVVRYKLETNKKDAAAHPAAGEQRQTAATIYH